MQLSTHTNKNIPSSLSRLFQDYDLESIDINSHVNTIMERTLEMGTWEELHWLFHNYGVQRIVEYLRQFGHRRLSKITFNYWQRLLDIRDYRPSPWLGIRNDIWIG